MTTSGARWSCGSGGGRNEQLPVHQIPSRLRRSGPPRLLSKPGQVKLASLCGRCSSHSSSRCFRRRRAIAPPRLRRPAVSSPDVSTLRLPGPPSRAPWSGSRRRRPRWTPGQSGRLRALPAPPAAWCTPTSRGRSRSPESNRANTGWWRGRGSTAGVTWRPATGRSAPNDSGKPIVVRRGDRLEALDIALSSGVAVEGRVIDENGEPLSLMFVVAARILAGSVAPQRVPHPPASTDDLGRYRIYGLEPGEYIVATESRHTVSSSSVRETRTTSAPRAVEPPGFPTTFHPSAASEAAAQRVRLTAGRDASGIDILVARTHLLEVSGTVLDSRGVPASATNGLLNRENRIRRRVPLLLYGCAGTLSGARSRTRELPAADRARRCRQRPRGIRGCAAHRCRRHRRPDPVDATRCSPCRAGSCWPRDRPSTLEPCGSRSSAAVPRCGSVETIAAMTDDARFRGQDVYRAAPGSRGRRCRRARRSKPCCCAAKTSPTCRPPFAPQTTISFRS